jgi:hypothetical protein
MVVMANDEDEKKLLEMDVVCGKRWEVGGGSSAGGLLFCNTRMVVFGTNQREMSPT